MKKLISIILLLLLIAGCTKQIPEGEKRISKTVEENNVINTIDSFIKAINSHEIETALSFIDSDFKGVIADSDNLVGFAEVKDIFYSLMKHYPNGKWNIKCEEVNISGEFAYIMTIGSFMVFDPVEKKINPVYSERSIRILKKQKDGAWKIFRYIAVPAFTYDQ